MRLEITDVRTLTDAEPNVRELEFRNKPVTVGSGSQNLVQLPDVEIAAHHATLLPMGEFWLYEPTTRDSDTKINGQGVHEKSELRDGDVIEVRFFSIRISLDSEVPVDLPDPSQVGELAKIRQYPLPPRSVTRKPDAKVSLDPTRQRALVAALLKVREVRDLATLVEQVADALVRELAARVVWIGVRKDLSGSLEFVESRNEQGVVLGEPPNLETFVYRCLNRQQFITIPRTGHDETQSVLAVPLLGERGALGLIYVDTRKHTRVFDEGDLDFLTLLSRLLTPLVERLLETGAVLPDLGAVSPEASAGSSAAPAASIRAAIVGHAVPQWPQFTVGVFARAGENTGDLHDVMKLPNGLAALLLAHVEGEPMCVAATIAQMHGAFRVAGLHADPPHVQLKALNWLLYSETNRCHADVVIAVINPKTGVLEIGSAGKLGVLFLDARGQPRKPGTPQMPPVGLQKNVEYAGGPARIEDGGTLALFTRGCITARNDREEEIGEKRFLAALCTHAGQAAPAAIEDLLADVPALRSGRAPDDVTILLAHFSR